jgi:hypothetical protein
MRRSFLALSLACLLAPAMPGAVRAQDAGSTSASNLMPVLSAARQLELDMSAGEVVDALVSQGFGIDMAVDLPPDGLVRMLLAVPEDTDCIPRGAPFVCPAIRVFLLNDPQRGHRVTRVESFQPLESGMSVAGVFERVAASLGPPLQTEMWPEQIRGGAVIVWRQRWREELTEGPLTEVVVTQEAPSRPGLGLSDPNAPAIGVGFIMADTEVEGAFAAVRRRLRPQR